MAKAEYKILMKCSKDFEKSKASDKSGGRVITCDGQEEAAEELSAEVTAHIRDGWSLHGSLSVTVHSNHRSNYHNRLLTFTQALFKPSGTTPGGTKPVATKRQRE